MLVFGVSSHVRPKPAGSATETCLKFGCYKDSYTLGSDPINIYLYWVQALDEHLETNFLVTWALQHIQYFEADLSLSPEIGNNSENFYPYQANWAKFVGSLT